ncbi:hypothetical protein KY49_4585 [Burkholderia sp. MSHR3999]|nr:hypothetical protein KY49_4585 [Burkholderia sp. MSHR3999]
MSKGVRRHRLRARESGRESAGITALLRVAAFGLLVTWARLRCRAAVIDRPAVAAGDGTRIAQRAPMRWQIGAADDATGDEMQVDAEERRIVVLHFAARPCRIGGVGKLPDAVNLDGIEPTRCVPDQSVGVADSWERLCGGANAYSYSPLEHGNNGGHDRDLQASEREPPTEADARSRNQGNARRRTRPTMMGITAPLTRARSDSASPRSCSSGRQDRDA